VKISGSKVGLARRCAYWALDSVELPPDTVGDPARIGTAFHALAGGFIERGVGCIREDAFPELDDLTDAQARDVVARAEDWAMVWPDIAPPGKAIVEMAYAYDPQSGACRELGRNIGRGYAEHGAKPHEICCSVDVVAIDGSHATIIDHKTGRGRPEHVSDSGQLQFAALCVVACNPGLESITLEYHYVNKAGEIDVQSHDLDLLIDLAAFRSELATVHLSVVMETAQPQDGPHCGDLYCPARATCPRTIQAAEDNLPPEIFGALMGGQPGADDERAEHVAWILAQGPIKILTDARNARAKAYAEKHGGAFDLGDGTQYKKCPVKGRLGLNTKAIRAEHGDKYDTTGKPGHSFKVVKA